MAAIPYWKSEVKFEESPQKFGNGGIVMTGMVLRSDGKSFKIKEHIYADALEDAKNAVEIEDLKAMCRAKIIKRLKALVNSDLQDMMKAYPEALDKDAVAHFLANLGKKMGVPVSKPSKLQFALTGKKSPPWKGTYVALDSGTVIKDGAKQHVGDKVIWKANAQEGSLGWPAWLPGWDAPKISTIELDDIEWKYLVTCTMRRKADGWVAKITCWTEKDSAPMSIPSIVKAIRGVGGEALEAEAKNAPVLHPMAAVVWKDLKDLFSWQIVSVWQGFYATPLEMAKAYPKVKWKKVVAAFEDPTKVKVALEQVQMHAPGLLAPQAVKPPLHFNAKSLIVDDIGKAIMEKPGGIITGVDLGEASYSATVTAHYNDKGQLVIDEVIHDADIMAAAQKFVAHGVGKLLDPSGITMKPGVAGPEAVDVTGLPKVEASTIQLESKEVKADVTIPYDVAEENWSPLTLNKGPTITPEGAEPLYVLSSEIVTQNDVINTNFFGGPPKAGIVGAMTTEIKFDMLNNGDAPKLGEKLTVENEDWGPGKKIFVVTSVYENIEAGTFTISGTEVFNPEGWEVEPDKVEEPIVTSAAHKAIAELMAEEMAKKVDDAILHGTPDGSSSFLFTGMPNVVEQGYDKDGDVVMGPALDPKELPPVLWALAGSWAKNVLDLAVIAVGGGNLSVVWLEPVNPDPDLWAGSLIGVKAAVLDEPAFKALGLVNPKPGTEIAPGTVFDLNTALVVGTKFGACATMKHLGSWVLTAEQLTATLEEYEKTIMGTTAPVSEEGEAWLGAVLVGS